MILWNYIQETQHLVVCNIFHVATVRVGSHMVFVWIHCTDVGIHCTDILI